VPVSLKDLMLVKGKPTGRGSLTSEDTDLAADDAPAIARLRAANAVFLGRTTTPEFGWKGCGDSPRTGITRNPWNLDRNPGGSSSGAATAVATGMGCLALGSDGGGSIRMPAGFCGIYGIRPATAGGLSRQRLRHAVPCRPDDAHRRRRRPDAGGDGGARRPRLAVPARPDRGFHPDRRRRRRLAHRLQPDLGYATVDPEIAALVRAAAKRSRRWAPSSRRFRPVRRPQRSSGPTGTPAPPT
jgi:aspartyl-tRNA(Asn)/glutamyl-tRNA(Gln) amidotransferase subunit A